MIINYTNVKNIYIVCGYTDMRKGIDGLAMIIQDQFGPDLYQDAAIFLYYGRRADGYKVLFWDSDGFVLLYKRIDSVKLQWPRTESEVKQLSQRELRWLLEVLKIDQPKA